MVSDTEEKDTENLCIHFACQFNIKSEEKKSTKPEKNLHKDES